MKTLPSLMLIALALVTLTALVWEPAALTAQPAKQKAKDKAKAGESAEPTPEWLWLKGAEKPDQVIHLRKTFEITGPVAKDKGGWLIATADNVVTVYVNGKKVLAHSEWQTAPRVDVTDALKPGKNVIAVQAQNEATGAAGVLVKLGIMPEGGKRWFVVSDASWKAIEKVTGNEWLAADFNDAQWVSAQSLGKLGIAPWGEVIAGQPGTAKGGAGAATSPESLKLLPGFKAELLHSVPKGEQGSWVNLCVDGKGRLIASNQNGLLYRITVDKPEKGKVEIEPIEVYVQENGQKKGQPIGKAHGLCWAYDALYVVICDGGGVGNGLYRLTDTDKDDKLDKAEFLKALAGGGEHGPHAVRLGPDGKLWVMAGNHTNLPAPIAANSASKNWAEDHLLPRNPDGNGHATGRMAPGGWICKTDKDGKEWELFCHGFRNEFDYDWNHDGEIFTYDSDMEWDTGVPWYRPTRVNHCVSGAEFGWRYGTGKWPAYYPDSLGATFDVGRGCPTGVTSGRGAKFPAKYQKAIYILDWTFGKLYAIHPQPQGSGYTATSEVFVEGKPLPLTDAVIGNDGAMYFTIGGRGTQSGLYRVTYEGDESTALVPNVEDSNGKEARATRRMLESFHGKQDDKAVAAAWPYLNSSDRNLRFAARVAIEWQAPETWVNKAFAETKPTALINAIVAVARTNDKALLGKAIEALNKLQLARLTEEQQLEAIRAYGLCFIRLGAPLEKNGAAGEPDSALASAVAKKIAPLFPGNSEFVNREAATLLIYLRDPKAPAKALTHMAGLLTQEDQFYYAFILRHAKAGWTNELRTAHFSWMNLAGSKYSGGNSFKKFIEQIRRDTQTNMSDGEKTALADVIKGQGNVQVVKETTPRQFVHNWQMDDLAPVIANATTGRNFERGKAAFEAAQCSKCHRFNNDGGSTGPDLTTLGNRFAPADVLEAIILPSKVVSDQYAPTEVRTKDGEVFLGPVMAEDADSVSIMTNPYGGEPVKVAKKDIETRGLAKTSLMPTGLMSILQKDEVLDLIAYLRAGGNKNDKAFAK